MIFFLNEKQKSIKSIICFIDYLSYQMLDGALVFFCYICPIYFLYKLPKWLHLKRNASIFTGLYQNIKIKIANVNSANVDDFILVRTPLVIWSLSLPLTILFSSMFPYGVRGVAFCAIQVCCILIAKVFLGTRRERKRHIQYYKKKRKDFFVTDRIRIFIFMLFEYLCLLFVSLLKCWK